MVEIHRAVRGQRRLHPVAGVADQHFFTAFGQCLQREGDHFLGRAFWGLHVGDHVGVDVGGVHADDQVGARNEYQLTDKGRALMPVLVTLAQWGEAHTQPQLLGTRLLDAHSLKPLRKVEIVSEDGRVLGVDDVVTQAPAP